VANQSTLGLKQADVGGYERVDQIAGKITNLNGACVRGTKPCLDLLSDTFSPYLCPRQRKESERREEQYVQSDLYGAARYVEQESDWCWRGFLRGGPGGM